MRTCAILYLSRIRCQRAMKYPKHNISTQKLQFEAHGTSTVFPLARTHTRTHTHADAPSDDNADLRRRYHELLGGLSGIRRHVLRVAKVWPWTAWAT